MSHVLVISPIPSHPQHQGNSARLHRLGQFLQGLGHRAHLVYYGLEGLEWRQRKAMESAWDAFHFLPAQGEQPAPSLGDHYHLDDWYDPSVGALVRELCARWDYAACIVNYVWFSRAFEVLPLGVQKILDTHDVFGDRHVASRRQGIDPSWYYTSVEEEARGVSRADLVLAIQDEERAYFERLGARAVAVVGYLAPACPLPDPARGEKLRLGYLGSANPFNLHAITELLAALARRPDLRGRCEVVIGGGVCEHISVGDDEPVELLGRIDSPADLYRQVQVLVNPMLGGTGLKIKTVEGLAYGRATLCTRDASVGLGELPAWMTCPGPDELCGWIERWLAEPALVTAAAETSRAVYAAYAAKQTETARSALAGLARERRVRG